MLLQASFLSKEGLEEEKSTIYIRRNKILEKIKCCTILFKTNENDSELLTLFKHAYK